ncbi:MAG: hypothetical protein IJ068_04525 [Bacilli bacterium]|nr:hypothetical protein [Bacilli bacterium]
MDNKKRLEDILKIRELRSNLDNLNLTGAEKEVLRRSFNYYENLLNLDIVRTNLNKEELDSMDIKNDIEVVSVPVENSSNKYTEYASVSESEVISIINKLCNELDEKVTLTSLKEYCNYLMQVKLLQKSNQELYDDIFNKSK